MAATQQSLIALIDTQRVIDPLDRLQIDAHSPRLEHRPSPPLFDGKTFDEKRDLARLTGQWLRVFNLMKDGQWRTLAEIRLALTEENMRPKDSEAAISARLRDFRKEKFGSHTVNRHHVKNGLYEYQLIVKK